MIHKIDKTNQILFDEMPKFDFSNPPIHPDELAKQLAESLIETTGVGLSANQIGLPYRAFALKSNPIYVMFNPIIVHSSDEEEYMEEGCLSFPNLIINIKRSKSIRVRFTQPNGKTTTEAFEGLTARVIQHEVDHLNGITFKQRATKYHLDKGLRKMKKRVYNKNIM